MIEEFYHRKLPHIQPKGAILFVTFRLAGSLPHAIIEQLQAAYEAEKLAATTEDDKYAADKRYFGRFDEQLHQSTGPPHYLKQPALAKLVADSLHYRDQRVYRLDAFTIMSNHVHVVFAPLQEGVYADGTPKYYKLSKIMQSLKRHTARECNRLLSRQGTFWQAESYDHVVRNEAEWHRIMRYVLDNPVKAGLVSAWHEWPYTYCAYL
jgi:REP element-mobilizing transposase RayT